LATKSNNNLLIPLGPIDPFIAMYNTPTRDGSSPLRFLGSPRRQIFGNLRSTPFRSPGQRGQHQQQQQQRGAIFKVCSFSYIFLGVTVMYFIFLSTSKPDLAISLDGIEYDIGIESDAPQYEQQHVPVQSHQSVVDPNVISDHVDISLHDNRNEEVHSDGDEGDEGDDDDNEDDGADYDDDEDDDGNEANYYDDDESEDYEDDFTDDNQSKTTTEGHSDEEECRFAQPYSSSPVPLILMSLGRSGSSVTWNTLSTMLGSTTIAYEVTGGNRTKAMHFFENLGPDTTTDWAINRLCSIQKRNLEEHESPVITGFQWKPYLNTLTHELGKGALEKIAVHKDPPIKILYLTRNPLDRLLSNERHRGHVRSETVPAHCSAGDEDCVKRHQQHSKGIVLPTGKELVATIRNAINIDTMAGDLLSSLGVSHITVNYEKLYNSKDAKEWIRILDFLGRSPKHLKTYKKNLKMKNVERSFAMAATSPKHHEDSIANFQEVKETLLGAGYGHLLH